MGLARGAIALLLEEAKRKPFSGRIATLGKQTIYASNREIRSQFTKFGFTPKAPVDWNGPTLDDVQLFRLLGFDTVHSFDYSDFEGADFVVDLNQPGMPTETVGAYDVVLDSGTLEHVFHLPNALANLADLARVGGRIILLSPSSNHIDHGFYMFSPTLFSDYFGANNFALEKIYVIRYSVHLDDPWEAYAYEPGAWRDLQIGGLDANPYVIFVVATKTVQSTSNVIPQQGYYANDSSAYVGSKLARDDASSDDAARAANPMAATQETKAGLVTAETPIKHQPAVSAAAYLRSVVGRIPGVRRVARLVMPRLRRFMASVKSTPRQALNKKLVGRY